MNQPKSTSDKPFAVEVEAGQTYFWCSCGKSEDQPFCDGSHRGSGLFPVEYEATVTKTVIFCGCKCTKSQPLCDGSHKNK